MQWIKATDRQPEDWIKAITRHWQTKHKAHYSHVKNGNPFFNVVTPENNISYVGVDSIEWLDETTNPVIYVASADYGIPWGETHKHILYVGINQEDAVKSISNLSRKPDKEGNSLEGTEIQVWINGKCEEFHHGGKMKKK